MSSRILLNCKKGFTLIEVLVSVALVSFIMMIIWQTTSQSIQAKKRIEKRDEVFHAARVCENKILQDISMAFLLKGNVHQGSKQGTALLKTVFKGDAEHLDFASLSHLRLFQKSRESDSTEVGYKLESDRDNHGSFILMRRESKSIDDNPDEGGVWIPIAKKVKKFKVEYYDATQFDWKTSWNSDNTEKDMLPRAVRLTLAFEDPGNAEKELPFITTVFIGMYRSAIEF